MKSYIWEIAHDYWCQCYRCQLWFANIYMPLLLSEITDFTPEEIK